MGYKSDIEIAQECQMLPITEIAAKAGISDEYLENIRLRSTTSFLRIPTEKTAS